MKYEVIYENDKVVFVAKSTTAVLVHAAKYWREVTLGQ